MTESKKNESAEGNQGRKPEPEKEHTVPPMPKPVGETGDNLRQRAEWFSRRTGKR